MQNIQHTKQRKMLLDVQLKMYKTSLLNLLKFHCTYVVIDMKTK